MKMKNLIKELQKFKQNTEVVLPFGDATGYSPRIVARLKGPDMVLMLQGVLSRPAEPKQNEILGETQYCGSALKKSTRKNA